MSEQVTQLIKELYEITNKLESLYPGRWFTPDGHLVGSIGEVLVAEKYGLRLLENSSPVHDAISVDGRNVQIKATQINKIALSSEPEYLIVIHITKSGEWKEIYNGPGKPAWDNAGKIQKNGQRPISLAKLHTLMQQVDPSVSIQKNQL